MRSVGGGCWRRGGAIVLLCCASGACSGDLRRASEADPPEVVYFGVPPFAGKKLPLDGMSKQDVVQLFGQPSQTRRDAFLAPLSDVSSARVTPCDEQWVYWPDVRDRRQFALFRVKYVYFREGRVAWAISERRSYAWSDAMQQLGIDVLDARELPMLLGRPKEVKRDGFDVAGVPEGQLPPFDEQRIYEFYRDDTSWVHVFLSKGKIVWAMAFENWGY